jgi:hypothetical protein
LLQEQQRVRQHVNCDHARPLVKLVLQAQINKQQQQQQQVVLPV